MKYVILSLFLLSGLNSKAQRYTTDQLSKYIRAQWKTNDSLRKDNILLKKEVAALKVRFDRKDDSDDSRNLRIQNLETISTRRDTLIGKSGIRIDSISKNKFAISIIK